MNRFLQKLNHIFRRKPEPIICGTLLLRMAEDQAEDKDVTYTDSEKMKINWDERSLGVTKK